MSLEYTGVLVVGAGFSGICMAARLKQSGRDDFIVLERGTAVGGVWRDNTYPGCACDVPSRLYSLTFAPCDHWSRIYAGQTEILAYLEQTAARAGLQPHLRLNAVVRRAAYDESASVWQVDLEDGRAFRAPYLILATGAFANPRIPAFEGLERFSGTWFHSSRWDHGACLDGRRVAVIGTGASAVQFIPKIQPRVTSLTVVQRTASWVLPRRDRAVGPWVRHATRLLPGVEPLLRARAYWRQELQGIPLLRVPKLADVIRRSALRHLARGVSDPHLRARLTPRHTPGCKRILHSDDYYPALAQPNVEVVCEDVRHVDANALVLSGGRRIAVDAIVLATGFSLLGALGFDVIGRSGITLRRAWRREVRAYLGILVAGFPNLFLLLGPNSGLGHGSVLGVLESQVDLVLDCIERSGRGRGRWIEVREPVQRAFNEGLDNRSQRTVWTSGCDSYYLDGRRRNIALWPGFSFQFVHEARQARRHPERFAFGSSA